MGRVSRTEVLYDGCYAHVFTRAIEKRRIFQTKEDFKELKRLLCEVKRKYKFFVYHYCFMSTHFHLVVQMNDVSEFSKGLGFIKKAYTGWYNFKNKRFGPVWRDRFRSLLIEDEAYLYACGLYVEMNPVKAGMVKEASDWKYSSSRYYQLDEEDELIDSYDLPQLPGDVDISDEKDFVKGMGIGSGFFRFQLKEKVFG